MYCLRMMQRRRSVCRPLLASLALLIGLQAYALDPSLAKVWIKIKPVQCMGNAWERAWQAAQKKHGQKTSALPSQERLIRAYFKNQGVFIRDVRIRPYVNGE